MTEAAPAPVVAAETAVVVPPKAPILPPAPEAAPSVSSPLQQVRKAVVAFGVGLGGATGAACLDGVLTTQELIVALGTGLIAGVATYKIKNAE